ncbi:MAG: c-type cytochrome domain-containing protein [Bradymonadaceae bacterium]
MHLLVPGEPEESEIYRVLVTTDETIRMPPPPMDHLPGDDIALIRDWIANGAPFDE